MRISFIICFFSLFASVALCAVPAKKSHSDEMIKSAKKALADRMKDPDSVQFKDVVFVEETKAVCGRFNAKNNYGAYVGFELFTIGEDNAVHVYGGDKCIGPANSEKVECIKKEMIDLAAVKANCSIVWPQPPNN